MAIEQREHDRTEVVELLDAMAGWEAPGGHVYGLHVGDIGWHLRMDDDTARRHDPQLVAGRRARRRPR